MNLEKSILNTIVYYDILNLPLTSFEVWKNLIAENGCTLGEVVEALESEELKRRTEEHNGFYFLAGRKELAMRRIENDKNSGMKFEIAEKAARRLRYVPFVRMIAVTGTLAMKNCEKNSDIDFFVVLEKGRIFTGRLLVTGIVHFLGRRRHKKKIRNRICLNYFVTNEKLEISRQDLFAANEYSFVYPIFNSFVIPAKAGIQGNNKFSESRVPPEAGKQVGMTKKSVFSKFCEANFAWIKKIKPNWETPELAPARYYIEPSKLSRFIQKTLESLINSLGGDRIETWLKKKQISRIERNPLTHKEGAHVEYSDQNLIFLPYPQGVRVEKEWQRRIEEIAV